MTMRVQSGMVLLVLVLGFAGCDSRNPSMPSTPSPVQSVPPSGDSAVLAAATVFGVVYQLTTTGQAPVTGVSVYCDACGAMGHAWHTTDSNGYYAFSGDLAAGGGVWVG